MSNVCIIPSRAGSKRIPHKNSKDFLGRPIIEYPLDAIEASELFDAVVVSTDDERVAGIAKERGCRVLSRPSELAGDHVTTAQVLEHALWHYDGYDNACCVYPTSVFLTPELLKEGHSLLPANVFAATPYPASIYRAFNKGWKMVYPDNRDTRTQDLPEHFYDAGLMYWAEIERFLARPVLLDGKMEAVVVRNVVDINTPDDWTLAESLYERSTGSLEG